MSTLFRPIFDTCQRLIDLEADRPGSSPLRLLGQGGPARELTILAPLNLPSVALNPAQDAALDAALPLDAAAAPHLVQMSDPVQMPDPAQISAKNSAQNSANFPGRVLPVLLGTGMGHALKRLLHKLPAGAFPLLAVVDKEDTLTALLDAKAPPLKKTENLKEAGSENIKADALPPSPHTQADEAVDMEFLKKAQNDPRILWINATQPQEALARLSHWQIQCGGQPFQPLSHPFYQRLDRSYYAFLREQLEASRQFDFWSKARLPRFRSATPRLLLITSRYFLVGEVASACARMGIAHRTLTLKNDELSSHDFVSALLRDVVEFQPDAVLTLNHLGVDREGVLTDLLAKLELPMASWFVDNPHLVLHLYEGLTSPWLALFTWDKDNIASLKAQGFEHVFHLPLGTDPDRFRPSSVSSAPAAWRSQVSFVGNSMVYKVGQRMQRTHFPAPLLRGFKQVAKAFTHTTERSVRDFILHHSPKLAAAYNALPDTEARLGYETLLTWESTRQYRTHCVSRLLERDVTPLVVGDPGWHIAFRQEKRPWRWHDALGYYDDLPRFYPLSSINFNTTSMQMKGAVNQRVFDVPAAGAFVLTDWREQMDELFEPGTEMVCYRHPDEIADLVRFYLSHPADRQRIALAGRRRVLACHTWDERLRTLLQHMRETFGS